jgi:D-alanyl-D-alanine carboxypeptidase (penicillin-binding protein 5/6)
VALALGLALSAAPFGVTPVNAQQQEQKQPKKKPAKQQVAPAAKPGEADPAAASKSGAVFETEARNAYLIDYDTGTVLYEKAADQRVGPASMSKMMTLYMAFEQIKAGRLSMEDTLPISDATWKKWNNSGSTMFIPVGARVKVDDLIRGISTQSGNDACVVIAEGLMGSEEAFAVAMTRRAKELGLTNSNFTNSTGWPDPDHYTTARDLAVLAKRLIQDFPQFYKIFSEKEFVYNNIRQGNRNPLLYKEGTGVDGIKTGHTEEAGYGLTASAIRNGRRLILVVHGLKSMKHRSAEAERMLDWGFREFNNYALFKKTDKVGDAEVWLGEKLKVALRPKDDAIVTLSRATRKELKVQVVTMEPVPAPVTAGQEIGKLVINAPGMDTRELPLVADADVDKLSALAKVGATLGYLVLGQPK